MTSKNLLFLGTESDRNFLTYLKPMMGDCKTFVDLKPISTLYEVEHYCKNDKRNISGVISTSTELLSKLTGKTNPSLDAYSGSYFLRNEIEYVFVNPLEHCVTVPYGKFLLKRFTSKLVKPQDWFVAPKFNWTILTQRNVNEEFQLFSSNNILAIACDIETFKQNLAIRCIGYTAIVDTGNGFTTRTVVLPMDSIWALEWMRRFNSLPSAKIFQNGKYDISYLLRYDSTPTNYRWDTANLFHCYYSELPKDLAFLQSFFVREAAYWKDLADTNDLEQYYLYNGKDTWATACVFLAWMLEAPEWAHKNYEKEFPVVFPCILSEATGVARDFTRMEKARSDIDKVLEVDKKSLDTMLGVEGFNANSPKQMRNLLDILGCKDILNADEKALARAAFRHPLNARIITKITGVPDAQDLDSMGIRGLKKLKSMYLRTSEDITKTSKGEAKELKGRILYSLNPHGTDTSRLSCKDHHFWCGLSIQVIPRGPEIKQTIKADDGFYFGECDLEQAETRDTAYITGDNKLIQNCTGEKDFHSLNAAAFFGKSYEAIYDDEKKKAKDKPLRDLSKRVNHGANYNMGAKVLVATMGEEKIFRAAAILKLPRHWTAVEIAQYLLDAFAKTYPVVRNDYQVWVINTIAATHKLVGATGWTRYCFYDPRKDKRALNAYIAHNPQSLNAQVLNEAYVKVFYDIAINPKHENNFKLCAQIHDSILFQYRIGHEYLAEMVKERMEIPVNITDIGGVNKTFTVPAAIKIGKLDSTGKLIPATYWSETE